MADELVQSLAGAVAKLPLWRRFDSMTAVGAFALCTDESLTNLLARAAPLDWLNVNAALRFWPPDWPMEGDDEPLDLPAALLERRYRSALAAAPEVARGLCDVSSHVEASFAHFVEALELLRQQLFFAPETLLLVFGTTPTPSMLRRATHAALKLNGDELLESWTAFWTPQRIAESMTR